MARPTRLGAPARAAWEGSLGSGAAHVVGPAAEHRRPARGAAVGACRGGAAVARARPQRRPRHRRRHRLVGGARSPPRPTSTAGWPSHATQPAPRGAVLGAVLGGAVAVAARALRGPVRLASCVAWLAGSQADPRRSGHPSPDEPAEERRDHDRQASSRAPSGACSAPRCARWNSRASSRARWTSTAPSRSRACMRPTSTRCGSRRGPRPLRGGGGRGDRRAVRLPARARPPRGPDPGLPAADRLPHRRAPLAGEFGIQARLVRPADHARQPAHPRARCRPAAAATSTATR